MTDLEELSESELVPVDDVGPLPPLPSFALLDDIEGTKTTRMPAQIILPRPRRRTRRRRVIPALIGSFAGFAVFALAVLITWRVAGDASAATDEGLILTVASNTGTALPVEIFVDGTRRCDSSPCRVLGLSAGHHFVNARSPGYLPHATRVIEMRSGKATLEHIELTPERAPVRF